MLQSIRDNTQGWIAGVIISILILSFALWGIHSYLESGSSSPIVAKVNKVEITKPQLAVAYERLRRQLQIQFNATQPIPEQAEAKIREQALQSLINMTVLVEGSLSENYRISMQQVEGFLENMPEFQVNGRFSINRFQQLMETSLYNTNDFLELIKKSLLIDQPRLGIIFTSFALPNEINTTVVLINQERDVKYAVLNKELMSKEPWVIPQDKINAYYQQHQNEFKTPEQVSVEYVEVNLKDLIAAVNPSDEKLKSFYNENVNLFSQPSKTESFEKVKGKVREVYSHQMAEEKFAEIREKLANFAYEHPDSLAPSAKEFALKTQVSDLFAKEIPGKGVAAHPKIREAAFSNDVLNLQNNSDVISITPDSFVVIRVKSHVPAAVIPLKTVESQIIQTLKNDEMDRRLYNLAIQLKEKLHQGNSDPRIKWVSVGFIGRHSNKVDSAILNKAFSVPRPKNNHPEIDIAKVPSGFAIVSVQAVRNGNESKQSNNQYDVFAEQAQNAQGLMEYELYKQSLLKKAKIVIES